MSRLTNLSTVKYKFFNYISAWQSNWTEKMYYDKALYEDLMLRTYLTGLFYKIKAPSNYFYISKTNQYITIRTNIFFYKQFKKSNVRHLFQDQFAVFYLYNKLNKNILPQLYNIFFLNNTHTLNAIIDLSTYTDTRISQWGSIKSKLIQKEKINQNLQGVFSKLHISNVHIFSQFFIENYKQYSVSIELIIKLFIFFGGLYITTIKYIYTYLLYKESYTSMIPTSKFYSILNKLRTNPQKSTTFLTNKGFSINWPIYIHCLNKLDPNLMIKKYSIHNFTFNLVDSIIQYTIELLRNNNATLPKSINAFCVEMIKYMKLKGFIQMYIKKKTITVSNLFNYHLNITLYLKFLYKRLSQYTTKTIQKVKYQSIYEFTSKLMSILIFKVENTITKFTKKNTICYFEFNFLQYGDSFNITNAKILCDYIIYLIHDNIKIRNIFNKIRKWHLAHYNSKKILEDMYYNAMHEREKMEYLNHLSFKRYPLLGIRIECSGTTKKGTMKQKLFYGDWVKDVELVSKNPNNSIGADLDYFQSFAITKSSTMGVKVWIFFKTHLYNTHKKYIGVLTY